MRSLVGKLISIDSDDWTDVGKIYKVLAAHRREDSTALELTVDYRGEVTTRTVPYYWIHTK